MAVILEKRVKQIPWNVELTKKQQHHLRNRVMAAKAELPHQCRFFTDPGHGWLEVSAYNCSLLDIPARAFSEYSYSNGRSHGEGKPFEWFRWSHGPMNDGGYPFHVYYLEEDLDAQLYIKRHEQVYDRRPIVTQVDFQQDAPIRALPSIY